MNHYLGIPKRAELKTELLPHQKRVRDKMLEEDRPGLVLAHGLGTGKCVRGDTPIYTNRGLLRLRDLFQEELPVEGDAVLPPGNTQVLSLTKGGQSWSPLRSRYVQKLPDDECTLVVTTHRGNRVEATSAHPLLLLREGELRWTPVGCVNPGDWVVMAGRLAEPPTPVQREEDYVVFLGWLMTEGWSSSEYKGRFSITQKDIVCLERLVPYLKKWGQCSTISKTSRGTHVIQSGSKLFGQMLEEDGVCWGQLSAHKELPSWSTALDSHLTSQLLGVIWEAEGHFSRANAELTLASPWLLEQMRVLLLRRGGRSSLRRKLASASNGKNIKRPYWRSSVFGSDLLALRSTALSERKARFLGTLLQKKSNPNTGVPCGWVYAQTKLSPNVLGVSANKGRTWSRETAVRVVSRLRELASLGVDTGKNLHGVAKTYSARTHALVGAHLHVVADSLEKLCSLDLAFEEVESVEEGEYGGWVFDVEVAAHSYDEHNYVGGWGSWYLHNTLSSIGIQDALGVPATVVVPAALKANYAKEQEKHIKGKPLPTTLETVQAAATRGKATPNPLLIVDEAHKLRDPASESHKAIHRTPSEKRVLLTASPFYNHPHDLAPLINLAARQDVLPKDRQIFEQEFIREVQAKPSLWQRIRNPGLRPGAVLELDPSKAEELKQIYQKWVDHHPGSAIGFPRVRREEVEVLMTPSQKDIYNTTLNAAPPWVAAKVRSGLPPSKKEMSSMAAFLTGPRQVGVSTKGFTREDRYEAPKVDKAFERLKQMLDANERAKAVVYSNYLESGIGAYRDRLAKAGVPFGEFTGQLSPKERDKMVRDYNEGKIKALLLSSAGGEGLDLKGTRLVQILEPHWNQEKLKQVEGRAARFKSHAHLPENEQEVLIEQYLSQLEPKKREGIKAILFGKENKKRTLSADEYLYRMSQDKERLISQFRALLPDSAALAEQEKSKKPGES